jgi:MFS family permease
MFLRSLFLSLRYQLGQAIGGYLIPPFSELIGRRVPYLCSSLAFSIFCLVIAAGRDSPGAVAVGRFVTGAASAVPSVVIAGSVEDVFNEKQRVWIVVLWNAGTTVGLALGPIYAASIIAAFGWKWVYYSASAVTFILFVALLAIRESRPSLLLGRLVESLRRDHASIDGQDWDNPDASPDAKAFVNIVVVRPSRILTTEPIVIMVAVISGVSWGIIYLFTEAMTKIYQSTGLTRTQASLPFLAIAVGVLFTFLPRIRDQKVVRRRRRMKQEVEPEDKITGFFFAAPALTIGLAWFAWTVPPFATNLHWLVPTLGLVPIGFAVNEIAYTLSGYLADTYLLYSASAFSGLAFIRAFISGLMPIISHAMYGRLGANIVGSILVGVSAVFCVAPWVFLRYSRRLRARSPFAKHSLDTHWRTQVDRPEMG